MKKLLIVAAATLVCAGAYAQGKLALVVDTDNLIYVTTDTTKLHAGDAVKTADNQFGAGAIALPGSSLYSGVNSTAAALGGSYVVALFGGTSSGSLSLQTTTTLADVTSGNCGGIPEQVNLTLAGLASGSPAWFQIQVYDSTGGASTAAGAWSLGKYAGQSAIFSAVPQTSVYSPINVTTSPVNSTWTAGTQQLADYTANFGANSGYFGGIAVYANAVPEPGTFALAGLGLASLLIFRRRNS